jgi:DNA-binding FrmR family transcriptional regulator
MENPDETKNLEPVATVQSTNTHPHHESVINRLARIEGHVHAVKRMVEQDVDCPDVLVQIAAVRAALNSVGRLILEDHVQSCMIKAAHDNNMDEAFHDLKKSLDQFIG